MTDHVVSKYISSSVLFIDHYCFPSSVVYLFTYEPHRDVTYSIHRDSQYSFLPHWYVEEMTSCKDSHHQS